MKRSKKIFLLSSSILTLATIPAIVGTFLVTKSNNNPVIDNQMNNFNTLAATPTTPVNFISSPNANYISNSIIDSYFYSNGNTLTSYSYGGVQQYIITLVDSSATIISYKTFEINGIVYIAILASNNTLYVYNNSNPIVPTNTFVNINSQYNQIMFSNDSLFIYSSQFSTKVLNTYTEINMQTLKVENQTISNSISALNNVFIFKIIPLSSGYNMIIFANNTSLDNNEITSSLTFTNLSYLIVKNNFTIPISSTGSSNISDITNTPTAITNFATPLTYSQINIDFKSLNTSSSVSSLSSSIAVATPSAFLFISNFVVIMQPISIPSTSNSSTSSLGDISSVVLSSNHAFFTIVGSNSIFKFNYQGTTTEFFDLNQINSSFNVANLNEYTLISTNSSTSVILTNNTSQKYYGITIGDFTSLNIIPSFQLNLPSGTVGINQNNTIIPALSSSLVAANLIMSNAANNSTSTQIFNINKIDYLSFDINAGTCTVNIFISQASWWNSSNSINSNIVIKITNFESFTDFLTGSTFWMSTSIFNNYLTNIESIQKITAPEIEKINPLNLSTLKQPNTSLIINPVINYTFTTNTTNNSINIVAYVTYTNTLDNVNQTITSTNNYSIAQLQSATFNVYGEEPGSSTINIQNAIGLSQGSLPSNIANFLPSYVYRTSGILNNSDPSIIQSFYKRFISSNLTINVVPQANDNTGVLTLTYIFSQPYNNKSSVTYTYTGFNTYAKFYSEFQGQNFINTSNSTIDVTKVESPIVDKIKTFSLSPYTLSTGSQLSLVLNNNADVSNAISNQSLVSEYLSSFINSNLSLMNFNPVIVNLSAATTQSLVDAMQNGILSLEMEYTGLTPEFASLLGLNKSSNPLVYTREVTFTNLPKITTLANISFNSKEANSIVDNYNSGTDINSEFESNILKNIIVEGYDLPTLSSQNVTMKWNGDILDIAITPPSNQLITEWNVLPATYNVQLSWQAKNARIATIIASSVTASIVVLLIIIAILAIWYYKKRTWLKKYF